MTSQAGQLPGLLAGNLQGKGYSQIASPAPVVFAMTKPAAGLHDSKVVAVVANTSSPSDTFAQVEAWLKKAMGRRYAGIVLLAQVSPPQSYLAEALGLGGGAFGYGQLVCGVYDLARNSYHLPRGAYDTYHLGWDQELFG